MGWGWAGRGVGVECVTGKVSVQESEKKLGDGPFEVAQPVSILSATATQLNLVKIVCFILCDFATIKNI